jgi:hypothetical protein
MSGTEGRRGAAVTREWRTTREVAERTGEISSHAGRVRLSLKHKLERLAATGAIERTVDGNGMVMWRVPDDR